MKRPDRGRTYERAMSAFADWVIARHRVLLIVVGLIVLTLASQIPRNQLTERWHEYFDETFEARRAVDAIDRHLGYLHVIRYSAESGAANGINRPEYLKDLERFAAWYTAQPEVAQVSSITDIVKRLNRNLHGDDARWDRIPDTREETAQYLLLYELALPQGLGLESSINVSRSATQLLVYAKRTDSEELLRLDARARAWLARNVSSFTVDEGSGLDMIFAHINHRNIRGLLKGVVVALIIISMFLVVALRSVRLGLLSLITNLAPAGLAYGLWAIVHGRIDLSASVVICLSIGIVVDDTVHFLSKYLRARREQAASAAEGLRYAFNTVGVALCVTTAVLVGGFSVLAASHFSPSVVTGTLLAITLSFALVVDLLLMPALLIALDRHWPWRGPQRDRRAKPSRRARSD